MIFFVLKHDRLIFRSLQGQIGEQCEPSELSKLKQPKGPTDNEF